MAFMKFSFLKDKITPDIPVMQVGFYARTHKSIGVHDDPYVSVVLMQANETVIIIALDLCFGDKCFAYGIKDAINKKYGLAQDKVIINYSHTHSVVAVEGEDSDKNRVKSCNINTGSLSTSEDNSESDHAEVIRYYNIIKDKIMNLIDEGFGSLIEGDAYICKGKSKFGVSRRFPSEEGIVWKPYFNESSIDTDLFLLKFIDKGKKIRGLIYNYACHPSTLGPDNYYISADFPSTVRRILEEANTGMTAVFLQGCGADIKPFITADNDRFKCCNFDEMEQAGNLLANEIQECIFHSEWRKIDAEFKTGYSDVKLYTEVWDAEKWKSILNDPDEDTFTKNHVEKILSRENDIGIDNYLPFYMSYFRLDGQTCFICLECEIVSDMGKDIKKLFDEDIIVLGYCNSRSCYIPTKKIMKEGGYESKSFIYAMLLGPFVPEVEDIIIGRAASMVSDTAYENRLKHL